MQKTLTFIILAGIVPIVFGCTNSPGETQLPPSPTQFLVLPIDAQGELTNISSLRSGPGMEFDEIATLPKESSIQIIGASTDIKWYLITYSDAQGISIRAWISAQFVKITLRTSEQPTSTAGAPILVTISPITAIVTFTNSTISTLKAIPTVRPTNTFVISPQPQSTMIGINTITPSSTTTLRPIITITISKTLIHATSTSNNITFPTKRPPSTIPPIIQPSLPPTISLPTKPLIVPTSPFFKSTPTPPGKN